jgi:hypothetical protein
LEDGQLLTISMLKVSSRLTGAAVAIKANRELMSKLAVYIFVVMTVVVLGLGERVWVAGCRVWNEEQLTRKSD